MGMALKERQLLLKHLLWRSEVVGLCLLLARLGAPVCKHVAHM